jgi:transaldolase/glucose-6-phosphate isomerase
MLNRIAVYLPDDLRHKVETEIAHWKSDDRVARIWKKDASVWTDDDEAKWLGWLDIIDEELGNLERYRAFNADIESAGFKDILLMGMGGSSLCPEVLSITFDKTNFHILDSTVPAQIRSIENKIDIGKTLFIVASKSGSTLEPNCFKQYFFDVVSKRVGKDKAGRQFVAITDPGSKMDRVAKDDGFRYIFYGKAAIGGRFSALSAFGLTAAAAMGIDAETLLRPAKEMAGSCRSADLENTGLLVGTILGICQKHGRNKLTILTGDKVHDLGAWLEQLVAESTGKNGIAIIPVDREPVLSSSFSLPHAKPAEAGTQSRYIDDRVFVSLSTKDDSMSNKQSTLIDSLKASDHPFIDIELESVESISQEFFRWEFATAVAGSIMGINPFNQPDVESAKVAARKLTDEYEKSGSLPEEKPFFSDDDFKLFTSDKYAREISSGNASWALVLHTHLSMIKPGDYFALLAYIDMNREHEELLQSIRAKILHRHGVATCLGFGPRFLHSTGQAYKGGPNSGVFLQITSDDDFDLPVPGQKYTFGIVKQAQARGDFQVLLDRGRRALRIHLCKDVAAGLKKLESLLS